MYEELKEITKEELTVNPGKFAAMANNGYKLDKLEEEITFVNFIDNINADAAEPYIPIHVDDKGYFIRVINIDSGIKYKYYIGLASEIQKVGVDNGNER